MAEFRVEICIQNNERAVEVILPNGTSSGAGLSVESLKSTDSEAHDLYPADGVGPVEVKERARVWQDFLGVKRTVTGHGNGDGVVTRGEVEAAEGLPPERLLLFDRVVHSALVGRRVVQEMTDTFASQMGKVSAGAIAKEHELLSKLCDAVARLPRSWNPGSSYFSFSLPSGHNVDVCADQGPFWNIRLALGTGADKVTVIYKPYYEGFDAKLMTVTRTIWDAESRRQTTKVAINGPRVLEHRSDALTDSQAAALRELHLVFDDLRLVAAVTT